MNPDDWEELKTFRTLEQLTSLGMRYRCELQTILKYGDYNCKATIAGTLCDASIFLQRITDFSEKLIARNIETYQAPVEKYWAAYSQLREITKQVENLLRGINGQ